MGVSECVCVCVRERETEREWGRGGGGGGGGPDRDGRNSDKQLRRKTPYIDLEKDRKI